MNALTITWISLLRVVRDRRALFFLIVLPVLVILIIGASVRGFGTFRVGVVDLGAGGSGDRLTSALVRSPNLAVTRYSSLASANTALARSEVNTVVVLPAGMDAALRRGGNVEIGVIAEHANTTQQAAATAVEAVVADQGARVQAATFATGRAGGSFDHNLALASSLSPRIDRIAVESRQAEASASILPEGFSYSAPTMLVLFVFLNALAGGAVIIETRRLGMYERMASAPVRPRTIVAGETLAFATIALLQASLIVFVGAVVFGVSWGNPLAAIALVVVWALVGAGAGMLAGTLFRTPEQASAMGPAIGIALGMLGGCMWPLAIVNPTMRQVGHATPQAWAVDAWTTLLSRGGTISSIAGPLLVLAGFAAAFLALATARLRRSLA